MDLSQYLRVLRKRWRLVLTCVLLGLVAGVGVVSASPTKYQASVKLFVAASESQADVSQALSGSQLGQQRVKSYADIVASKAVLSGVISALGLPDTASSLQSEISASAPLDTVLVKVSVTDRSPARAQAIANEVGKQFSVFVGTLETPQGSRVSPVKVTVVEPADRPTAPESPNTKLDLVLGLLVGLVLGVGGAVLRETLDTTVKRPDEATEITGAALLGVIAFDSEASRVPLVVEASPHSVRAEAFRQLRTNLQFIDIDKPARSIVITSALPREGKSTTTINLALTLARAGKTVCLIEGDLRRPRVGRYLGIPDDVPGLTDVLIGSARPDEVLIQFRDTSLVTMSCGARPPNPSELLGSDAMRAMLTALESNFDVVIIDAPPLLPVTDAAVLSSVCDGVVVLARAGRTRREQLARAMESLRSVDAHVLGVVLNMVSTRGPDAYIYGYGYGYSYTEDQRRGLRRRAKAPSQSEADKGSSRPTIEPEAAQAAVHLRADDNVLPAGPVVLTAQVAPSVAISPTSATNGPGLQAPAPAGPGPLPDPLGGSTSGFENPDLELAGGGQNALDRLRRPAFDKPARDR